MSSIHNPESSALAMRRVNTLSSVAQETWISPSSIPAQKTPKKRK